MTPRISSLVRLRAISHRYGLAPITLRAMVQKRTLPVYVVSPKLWLFDVAQCDEAMNRFHRPAKAQKRRK